MSTKKKGMLTVAKLWAKHLRKHLKGFNRKTVGYKRSFWRRERLAAKQEIARQLREEARNG